MKTASVLTLALILFCTGCVVLPIPHRRMHACAIKGIVLDAQTGQPVEDASVTGLPFGQSVQTGPDGRFCSKPVYQWHGAVLIGPTSYSLLPTLDMVVIQGTALAEATGYAPTEQDFNTGNKTDDSYLLLDDILLEPKSPDSSP